MKRLVLAIIAAAAGTAVLAGGRVRANQSWGGMPADDKYPDYFVDEAGVTNRIELEVRVVDVASLPPEEQREHYYRGTIPFEYRVVLSPPAQRNAEVAVDLWNDRKEEIFSRKATIGDGAWQRILLNSTGLLWVYARATVQGKTIDCHKPINVEVSFD